jgi:amidase
VAFHVAGLRSTWGNPAFREFVADRDATVVRRLRQAGAIILGGTNVAFMLSDFAQTGNDLYGTTVNPWDRTRTPGGSSGGSAAVVAAGIRDRPTIDLIRSLEEPLHAPCCRVLSRTVTP